MNRQTLRYDPRTRHLTLCGPEQLERLTAGDIASASLSIVALVLCVIYFALLAGLLQP